MTPQDNSSLKVYPEAVPPVRKRNWWQRRPRETAERPKQTEGEAPGQLPEKPGWGADPDGVGISLSGGGIRSAAFCLGALQSLTKANILFGQNHAKYLSSVSGGSYIATAMTMVTTGRLDGGVPTREDPTDTPKRVPEMNGQDFRPFAHGSPEEQYLRNRTLYLTHGSAGIPGVVWRVFLGVLLNLFIAGLSIALVFGPLGWIYGWAWPSLRAGCPTNCPVGPQFSISWILWVVIAAIGGLAIVLGCVWLAFRFKSDNKRFWFGVISGGSAVAALVLLLFAVAIPWIIHLARPYYLTFSPPPAAHATKATTVAVTSVGLLAVLGGWIAAARRLVSSSSAIEKDMLKTAEAGVKKYRTFFINLAATIAGPLLVLAGVVTAAYWGSAYPASFSDAGLVELLSWVAVLAGWLFIWNYADVTAWSLYPMYRNRLSAGFVLRRIMRFAGDPPSPTADEYRDANERPYDQSYWLSDFKPDRFPEVIICASANISDYGETPSGSHVTSFTFSSQAIGGPIVGSQPTAAYENALGRTESQSRFATLPTAMAISAAAISPSMGRMTRAPFRFFLALANLRLGVWVPNPRQLDKFAKRQARKWYQLSGVRLIPRPWYLVREMLGWNGVNSPFLYVTDGGHYENLGLVELLRRKCKTIWCIDASGDKVDTFSTLGGALQTAQAELQVSVRIDPQKDMDPQAAKAGRSPQFVAKPFCVGQITYADGTTGTLIHVKAGVPTNAPLSVQSYALQHQNFPCDSTLDQLYDADRFDAYRELGAFSVQQAVNGLAAAVAQMNNQITAAPGGPAPGGPAPGGPAPGGPAPGGPADAASN
jgi:hypothetical protein